MKIQLSPRVCTLSSNIKLFMTMNVILNHYMGNERHIDIINKVNKPLEPKLQGGDDNRSVAILTD